MIVIAEITFTGWVHEECNSGMIRLITSTTSERVCLAAHKTHIDALKKVGLPDDIKYYELDFEAISWPQKVEEEFSRKQLVKKIICEFGLSTKDKIVFLASPKIVMSAAVDENKSYGIPLYFIIHADLDEVLKKDAQLEIGYSFKMAIEKAGRYKWAHFITFCPYAKEKLKKILSNNVLSKFDFLNHPINGEKIIKKEEEKIIIGAYGACVNQNLFLLFKQLQDKKYENEVRFDIYRRVSFINQLDCKYRFPNRGVRVRSVLQAFSREEKLDFLSHVDWILLPYDESMYQVSMSGILADAIEYEIPILALNSSIVNWYNKDAIGVVTGDVSELSEIICSKTLINREKHFQYKENIRKLKTQIELENTKIMLDILRKEL